MSPRRPKDDRAPSQVDVARLAGVSTQTVSRVMSGQDNVRPETARRVLAAVEELKSGEVLAGLLGREPVFLFPELAKRGHAWRGGFDPDGTTYRVLVRVGGGPEQ